VPSSTPARRISKVARRQSWGRSRFRVDPGGQGRRAWEAWPCTPEPDARTRLTYGLADEAFRARRPGTSAEVPIWTSPSCFDAAEKSGAKRDPPGLRIPFGETADFRGRRSIDAGPDLDRAQPAVDPRPLGGQGPPGAAIIARRAAQRRRLVPGTPDSGQGTPDEVGGRFRQGVRALPPSRSRRRVRRPAARRHEGGPHGSEEIPRAVRVGNGARPVAAFGRRGRVLRRAYLDKAPPTSRHR